MDDTKDRYRPSTFEDPAVSLVNEPIAHQRGLVRELFVQTQRQREVLAAALRLELE